eukprot:CAMPEP_0116556150 /NCGR_PEP_ID=MMETSP0397-20121206/8533_1 /TAXON_ID=216820 /ORGANISM="Cyclophora tenuis, Strain ECT3854" /LENGTH=180 /DNA_ID=CAMNT_0004081481 /DNA_START=107 /DNA_END=649 /DNA_ORIENTATION=+
MANFALTSLLVAVMVVASLASVTASTLAFRKRGDRQVASTSQGLGRPFADKKRSLNTPIDADAQQAHPAPPGGALYTISVTAPIIGRHDASVLFYKDSSCRLTINGSVKIDERVAFDMNPNGSFKYALSEKTTSILRRLLVRVKETGYDVRRDETYMIASVASVLRFRVRLKRSSRQVMA